MDATDQELVAALQRGDSQAADIFFERYADRLYRYIYYQVGGNQGDAEDILQETFMSGLNSLGSFRGDSQLYTWLYRIATFKVINFKRKQSTSRQYETSVDFSDQLMTGEIFSKNILQNHDTHLWLSAGLSELSPNHRQVLILKYVEGFSVKEIAEIFEQTPKAIESSLGRARRALAKILTDVDMDTT